MAGIKFERATKTKLKGRIGIMGPSGSGKTWTALLWARELGRRVAVIDTENRSASKYADLFEFDRLDLTEFAPRVYIEAIHAAEKAGYDVLVIDGLSPAWAGKGGVLEIVDQAAARSRSKNTFAAWREGTPEHNALVEALVQCKCHLIVTMRSKVEYVLDEDERGKKMPRKIGMAPIQREGLEYEFDLVGDMDWENRFVVTKSRCSSLSGQVFRKPGPDVAQTFLAWLDSGVDATPPQPTVPTRLSDCTSSEQVTSWIAAHAADLHKAATGPNGARDKARKAIDDAAKRVGLDPSALIVAAGLAAASGLTAAQTEKIEAFVARWADLTHVVALKNWWTKHEEEVASEGPEFYDELVRRSAGRHAELAALGTEAT